MSKRNLKEILTSLLEQYHLLSVADILKKLEQRDKTYNKTSVYRALDQLVEDGVLCRQYFTEAEAVYELRAHGHAHAVCTQCGAVQAVECEYAEPQTIKNFKIDHHHVTILGTCARCATQ